MSLQETEPLISVVMPVYNCEKYLDAAVESVIGQSYRHWELVLVDDCSTDKSGSIANGWAERDPRIAVIHNEKNSGVSVSRNNGIAVAKGDWVAFLDSDDVWMPTKLERQVALVTGDGLIDGVFTGYGYLDADSRIGDSYFAVPAQATYSGMLVRNVMSTSGNLLRRALLVSHPFSPGAYHEDLHEWLTLLKGGARFVGIDEPLHYVRIAQKESRSGNKVNAAAKRFALYRSEGIGVIRSLGLFAAYAALGLKKYSGVTFRDGVDEKNALRGGEIDS